LKSAHNLVDGLRGKLAAEPLEGLKARDDASKFLKTLAGLIRLLERADTTDAFNQLRRIQTTTLGNLIAFVVIPSEARLRIPAPIGNWRREPNHVVDHRSMIIYLATGKRLSVRLSTDC
jgi:hypothetical protein